MVEIRSCAADVARPAIKLAANDTLQDLRNTLLKYGISRAVVTEEEVKEKERGRGAGLARGGKPVGILTEKDVSRFLYSGKTVKPLNEIAVAEILPPERRVISVKKDASLAECARKMIEHGISSLVVVDENGETFGIFTKTDLLDLYTKHFAGRATVEQYMTREVKTVRPDEPVHSVLMLMANWGISRVVVVSHNKPVGIITGRDLLLVTPLLHEPNGETTIRGRNKEEKKNSGSSSEAFHYIPSGSIATILAEDVMKSLPITITNYSDVADAAMIMKGNKISGLPVVNSDDELVGIITTTDVIRAISDFETTTGGQDQPTINKARKQQS